jgi:hypothetical protein
MLIFATSDIHGSRQIMDELKIIAEEVDAIFLCGDLFGKEYVFDNVKTFAEHQQTDYLYLIDVLEEIEAKGVMCRYILGNDDWFEANDRFRLADNWTIDGIIYHPFPFIGITPFHTNRELEEFELREELEILEAGQDSIIVGHMVPENCGDTLYNGEHVGSVEYQQWIEKVQPLLVLSGHIHECGLEVNEIGNTLVLNCASEHQLDLLRGFIIDTDTMDVEPVEGAAT